MIWKKLMNEIKFNSYSKEYSWLSNFYEQDELLYLTILKNKIAFNSVEAAFQSLKLLYLLEKIPDIDLISYFKCFSKLSKSKAKQAGNKLSIDIKKWDNDRLLNMEELVFRKFQNQVLKHKLISTGNDKLIEFNTGSKFWGVDQFSDGQNHLGIIIEKVRDKIKTKVE